MTGWMWLFATVIGAAVLGFAILYGRKQSDEVARDPRAARQREEATRKVYEREERETGD